MQLRCPGCRAMLHVEDETYKEQVLLQCPECLYVFLAKAGQIEAEDSDLPAEEATLLTSDFSPDGDPRDFRWNVPGASITIIEGDRQGVHHKLREDKLVIGRKGADLELEDKAVSRKHVELSRRPDGWWLTDLESTNGTYVNGQKVDEEKLAHLDEIRVGTTRILYAETEAPEERSVANLEEDREQALDRTKADTSSKEPELPLPLNRELYLEHMTGDKKGRSVKFMTGRAIIGRGDDADVILDDPNVSRKHAMIEAYSREQIYITDLASHNGTWLNGMQVRTTKLFHGDLIRLGNSVLKFIIQDLPQ